MRSLLLASCSCLLALTACQSTGHVADFAANELFYKDLEWRTKAPGDRAVCVLPVVDTRDAVVLPTAERGLPIRYGSDDFWDRPVPEMLGEVLVRQLQDSALFTKVQDRPSADVLLVKPVLQRLANGAIEEMSGARSFAEIALQIQVLGPAGADGKRVVLHEQTYGNRTLTPNEINPTPSYLVLGRALRATMQKMLVGLDGSNVARSTVPVEVGLPAEASATPAPQR
ncbi:MAG: hypothetical protein JNK15_06875 [Planctomycetes bacterium]|nr:hypothetical protein [Planctomycetota bacterium]